jgi:type II secretion system protein H
VGFVIVGMRERATRTSSTRTATGFTLIEVLVVVAILAIAATVAIVAYDGDERGAVTREARRLAGAMEHASLRAQVRAETLGISAEGSHWRFWRRASGQAQWQPVTDDDVLRTHALPELMRVVPLRYAGRPLAADAIVPLRPTGRNEPYALALEGRATTVVLAADTLNRVTLAAGEISR